MDDNEKIKDILACIIKHIRPDGEFYPFTRDEVEKMKECLNSKTKHNCLSCKYFDKNKKLMQEYGCLRFTATIDDPYEELRCYEEEVAK